LGTVLVLDLEKFSAASASLTEDELSTVQLVDGRRAIFEIIDDSGRDAVDVLREIDQLISRGLVSADSDAPGGVGYGDAKEGESGIVPPPRSGPPSSRGGPASRGPLSAAGPSPSVAANDRAPDVPTGGDAPPSSTSVLPGMQQRPTVPPMGPARGGPKLGRY